MSWSFSMRLIGLAFILAILADAAWAESCSAPVGTHGKPLTGHAKRVFIKECCERLAQTRGGSLEERRHFVSVCQKELTSDYIKRHCLGWRPALFDELATESCTAHVRFWG